MSVLDECWVWGGHRNKQGYGRKAFGSKRKGTYRGYYVHRLAWEWVNGPIPEGMCVCHRCDNPPCVNPAHLFLGTNLDNVRDREAKHRNAMTQKTHCKRGHPFAEHGYLVPGSRGRPVRQCSVCRKERNRLRYVKDESLSLTTTATPGAERVPV